EWRDSQHLNFYANRWEYGSMYTPAQFAKRVNVSVKTSQKWDRLGILSAKRTITSRRYYTDEDFSAALRMPPVPSIRPPASLLPRLKSGPITGFSQSKKNPCIGVSAAADRSRWVDH